MICLQSFIVLPMLIATIIGSSSDLIYYLVLLLLLLLSGDVEINPGPMIDDQPDIFQLLQWLEPLVEWQSFGILLPGITQQDITIIEQLDTEHQKLALFTKWLNTTPTAIWRDVLYALKQCKQKELIKNIENQMKWFTARTEMGISINDSTSTEATGGSAKANSGPITGTNIYTHTQACKCGYFDLHWQ